MKINLKMEAVTLKTRKPAINKGKIKKTVKNILCRPDDCFWPLISEDHKGLLNKALQQYKVEIPSFRKPHWKELKLISKEKRPKPPKIPKVDGLIFGISECSDAIKSNVCAGVIVEAGVNPKIIVQPLIEACVDARIPVLCVDGLRTISSNLFGIPTSALAVKCDLLTDLQLELSEIAKNYSASVNTSNCEVKVEEKIEISKQVEIVENNHNEILKCPYLYRTDRKSRIFIPSGESSCVSKKVKIDFSGQDFVEFSKTESTADKRKYIKMKLKKISSNPNRVKLK